MTKFLDKAGLTRFWNRAKDYIDNHSPAAALPGTVEALAAADRVNLLAGTNRGTEGWSTSTSSDGRILARDRIPWAAFDNQASTGTPGWQTLLREVPAGLFADGEEYVLSFRAMATRSSGSGPLTLNVSVGDAAATRTLADSGWFYVETGGTEKRYAVRLTGALAGAVTKAGDFIKIAFVAGQNAGWASVAFADLKLERGTVATGYTPAPADGTEELRSQVAALTAALSAVTDHLNHQGVSVCVLAEVNYIDSVGPEQVPLNSLVLDESECCVYQSVTNPVTRIREFVISERWNYPETNICRSDVLYFCSGEFYWWDPDLDKLVKNPGMALYPGIDVSLPAAEAAEPAALSDGAGTGETDKNEET